MGRSQTGHLGPSAPELDWGCPCSLLPQEAGRTPLPFLWPQVSYNGEQGTQSRGNAPAPAPEGAHLSQEQSRRKYHPGTSAGWGAGQASTWQPPCGPDLRICRNRGLGHNKEPVTAWARGGAGSGNSTLCPARADGPVEGPVAVGLGEGSLTSRRSPCAQPRAGGTGPGGSEASCRPALGVWGPLLRRGFYMGEKRASSAGQG